MVISLIFYGGRIKNTNSGANKLNTKGGRHA
jgi:hypothetical protein